MARMKSRPPYNPEAEYLCRHCNTLLVIGKPGTGNITENKLTKRQDLICRSCHNEQQVKQRADRKEFDAEMAEMRAVIHAQFDAVPPEVRAERNRKQAEAMLKAERDSLRSWATHYYPDGHKLTMTEIQRRWAEFKAAASNQ